MQGFSRQKTGSDGVKQTLRMMATLKHQFKTAPEVREMALSLIDNLPQKDYRGEVESCWRFVKDSIRYVKDVAQVETVQSPLKTLEYRAGDCDDKSTLLATLLESIGHPCKFKAVGIRGGDYCHVYVMVKIGAQWVPLETTEPVPMGWEPPNITKTLHDSEDGTESDGILPDVAGLGEGYEFGWSPGGEKKRTFQKQKEQMEAAQDVLAKKQRGIYVESDAWYKTFLDTLGIPVLLINIYLSEKLILAMGENDVNLTRLGNALVWAKTAIYYNNLLADKRFYKAGGTGYVNLEKAKKMIKTSPSSVSTAALYDIAIEVPDKKNNVEIFTERRDIAAKNAVAALREVPRTTVSKATNKMLLGAGFLCIGVFLIARRLMK